MCRNIKNLYNFKPEVTDEEIHDASLQFVRKISGFSKTSKENEEVFNNAVEEISHAAKHLLYSLHTQAEPKTREEEREKSRIRNEKRFGSKEM